MPAEAAPDRLTPQEAVDAAAWQVGGPVLALMLGPPAAVLMVGRFAHEPILSLLPVVGMVAIVSWLVAWLAWSILTPRWRLWAYERVDDLDELRRVAIADRVLWPEGHIIHRSELATPALRERLAAIEAERRASPPPPTEPRPEPRAKSKPTPTSATAKSPAP